LPGQYVKAVWWGETSNNPKIGGGGGVSTMGRGKKVCRSLFLSEGGGGDSEPRRLAVWQRGKGRGVDYLGSEMGKEGKGEITKMCRHVGRKGGACSVVSEAEGGKRSKSTVAEWSGTAAAREVRLKGWEKEESQGGRITGEEGKRGVNPTPCMKGTIPTEQEGKMRALTNGRRKGGRESWYGQNGGRKGNNPCRSLGVKWGATHIY